MFFLVLTFLISLVGEVILLIFISPEAKGITYHVLQVSFALISGILSGSLFSLLLIGLYYILGAVDELQKNSYIRRGVLLGAFVTVVMLTRIYKIYDVFILSLLVFIVISLELIFAKSE